MAPKRTDVENARQQRARAELMQDSPHILKLFDEVVEREQARDRETAGRPLCHALVHQFEDADFAAAQ